MCVHGRTVPSSLGPCLERPCLPEPPPGPGGQAPVHPSASTLTCLPRVCPQASCGRFQPGLLSVSVSALQGGDTQVSSHPADPGRRAAQAVLALRESPVSPHHQPCSPRAGVGCGGQHPPAVHCWVWGVGQGWGQDGGWSPRVERSSRKWAVQRQIPLRPLQWWPEGRIEEPHRGAYMRTGRQMTADIPGFSPPGPPL